MTGAPFLAAGLTFEAGLFCGKLCCHPGYFSGGYALVTAKLFGGLAPNPSA